MGLLSTLKKIGHHVVQGARKVVEGVGYAVVGAVECTLELCEDVANGLAEGARWVKDKIKEWTTPAKPEIVVHTPVEFVHPNAKEADAPLVENANAAIMAHFPERIYETSRDAKPEERKRWIEELVPKAAQAMGLKNPPELMFEIPDDITQVNSLCGGYSHSNNTISINLAMVVSSEPELFQEQVSTIFHEMVHARQWEAVSAWAAEESFEEYGYSEDYIKIMAENFCNYISYRENPEAYAKQPVEAEAFYFESQIRSSIF